MVIAKQLENKAQLPRDGFNLPCFDVACRQYSNSRCSQRMVGKVWLDTCSFSHFTQHIFKRVVITFASFKPDSVNLQVKSRRTRISWLLEQSFNLWIQMV
jgi:hypothetical protein